MDIDEVFSHIGEFGPAQKKYVLVISLAQVYIASINLNMEFTAFAPEFECYPSEDGSAPLLNACPDNEAAKCARLVYNSNYSTIVTEWNLVCDQAYRAKGCQSAFMAGLMVAAPLMGPLADKVGRLRTIAACLLVLLACFGGSMAAPTFDVFLVLRFVSGSVTIGMILSTFVLASEVVGASQRAFCGNLMSVMFALGIPVLSAAASLIHSWRHLYLLFTLFGCAYFSAYFYLPESPRWLLLKGREEAALRVLQRIARCNGTTLPAGLKLRSAAPRAAPVAEGVCSLFKYRKVAVWTLVMMFSWFTNNLCYYGLTSASATMGSDRFTSVALSGLIELPAYAIVMLVLNRVGRRTPLCGFMLLGGGCCLGIMGLPHGDARLAQLRMLLGLIGKLCAAASFSVIFIHSGEIFPTSIRNTGFGLVNVFARIGGIVYPFMALLNDVMADLHFAVFGALAVGSGLLNLMLPETLGRPLPETVEELAGQTGSEMYSPLRQLADDEDGHEPAAHGGRRRVVKAV
ncbi:solute carrier family 22 member 15-like isoform X1 [Pollicipes pollicipes]|uniref:solute carrier family 22 member 15-like isoform X1 n=2 Tax=Pollicipes pollicipes TaxID=41117 RepID=UPI0018854560|nr:solute carrier family 22 member 15-like isoform X1 [Pollicipes pollicipes]XP_037072199.1 solute carrier family 22 member 15-like isoform X1 [Pollicipes pollicipes]XP_037072200.1 solute carrier family 22 member 15-like isoform X1 [Pollicipes pollicipes]XP_037072201.1 solute carrier family 22 member 15-like isoform X1 [Pollicipes pollicipes]XP_037072202.1 solute carrier family 22 member 15-like isoform X1 [Pollicipes pollicipes]